MSTYNTQIFDFLKNRPDGMYTASQIVQRTGLSFTTVRNTLNKMREARLTERDLDMGQYGKTIHRWYWTGPREEARPEELERERAELARLEAQS